MKTKLFAAACLFMLAAYPQPPAPDAAVEITGVDSALSTTGSLMLKAHNKGSKDITYMAGKLTYTPYGLAPVETRCSTVTLFERYVYATSPKLQGVTRTIGSPGQDPNSLLAIINKPPVKGTLNAGEDLEILCGVSPTKIQSAEFVPDTVIYADQTWSGDQLTAQAEFKHRQQAAADYAKLLKAVTDCEKAPDPTVCYKATIDEWEPLVGITHTPTATIHHQTKVSDFPYHRLLDYYRQYLFSAEVNKAAAAKGQATGTVQQAAHLWIDLMKRRDIALGVAYHIHSEAK